MDEKNSISVSLSDRYHGYHGCFYESNVQINPTRPVVPNSLIALTKKSFN